MQFQTTFKTYLPTRWYEIFSILFFLVLTNIEMFFESAAIKQSWSDDSKLKIL